MFKKLAMSMLSIAAITALVAGGTFALFSAETGSQENTFTAGTVTLGTPSTTLINVTKIAPGDSGSATYTVTYTGSLQAWLGLTVTSTGDLFTCDDGDKYTYSITSPGKTYDRNTANQVVGSFNQNDSVVFTLAGHLLSTAGNDCQGDSASISLQVKAVQARNNTNPTSTGPNSWN